MLSQARAISTNSKATMINTSLVNRMLQCKNYRILAIMEHHRSCRIRAVWWIIMVIILTLKSFKTLAEPSKVASMDRDWDKINPLNLQHQNNVWLKPKQIKTQHMEERNLEETNNQWYRTPLVVSRYKILNSQNSLWIKCFNSKAILLIKVLIQSTLINRLILKDGTRATNSKRGVFLNRLILSIVLNSLIHILMIINSNLTVDQ